MGEFLSLVSNSAFVRKKLVYFPVSESLYFLAFLPSRGKNRLENKSKVLRVQIVESS